MSFGDAPPEHLYTNQTSSYFRAPHIYVGIAARFMPGRQVLTAAEAAAIRVDPKYFQDCSDAVLLTTRGGSSYERTISRKLYPSGDRSGKLGLAQQLSRAEHRSDRTGRDVFLREQELWPTDCSSHSVCAEAGWTRIAACRICGRRDDHASCSVSGQSLSRSTFRRRRPAVFGLRSRMRMARLFRASRFLTVARSSAMRSRVRCPGRAGQT